MANTPSFKGIGSAARTVLRTTKKEKETVKTQEKTVSTQRPNPSTPSPRGHA